jgi:chromosome partitioning protein
MNKSATSTPAIPVLQQNKKAYVIVIGNEKGGCGKTTTAMHLIVALLRMGFSVGSIDIDSRQRSLSRYLENRKQTMLKEDVPLPTPQHVVVQKSPFNIVQEAEADEHERFTKALARIQAANDFIVIDSPGSDTYLARVAHAYSNTVITPINDSFVDLDVLANVDGQTMKIIKPSIYSEMMWEQKLQRAKRDGGSIEWIVMRNRLSNIDAKNKRFMTQVTGELSRRIGFRVAPGFSERVIFREMFLQGLTVLDIMETKGASISMSHIAARQEVRDLLRTLKIQTIEDRLAKANKDESDQSDRENKIETPAEAKSEAPVMSVEAKPAESVVSDEAQAEKDKVVSIPPSAPAVPAMTAERPLVELAS